MDSHLESESARLLPKEEKKHEWTTDEIMSMVEKKPAQPTPNFPKGGTTFTESAYKEPQDKEQLIGLIIDDFKNGKEIFVPAVESSEPQEKVCKACEIERNDEQVKQMPEHTCKKGSPMDIAQPKSAPSESQEDLRTKLQRYQQTLIARYYNNDLTEKEKIDLNKIIDELSDLLK